MVGTPKVANLIAVVRPEVEMMQELGLCYIAELVENM